MPLLNFQKQFAPLVESGQKTQTIRAPRKDPIKVGDTVYLWTGCRTKHARKLGEGIVTAIWPVVIDWPFVLIRTTVCSPDSTPVKVLAEADGFGSVSEMLDWFQKHHGLPFAGQVIRWRLTPGPRTRQEE